MVHRPRLEKGVDVGVLRDIDSHAAARRMSRSRRALAITGAGRAASVFVDPSCGCKRLKVRAVAEAHPASPLRPRRRTHAPSSLYRSTKSMGSSH